MNKISSYLKLTILLAGLTAIFIAFGYYFAGEDGMIFAGILGLILNFFSYWFSDKVVLAMTNAKESDWRSLNGIKKEVEKVCKNMEIPLPKLFIMETAQANAFATGRNPKHAVVCLTTGIISQLEEEQLLAVIAHELSHIKNYDILIASIAAVLASAISSIQNIAYWGGFGGRDREERNPFLAILLLITAPIIAILLQFGISRSREYEADATAAKYTKNPEALASALIAIDSSVRDTPNREINTSVASLFIHSPFSNREALELFSTHPLTEKRVEKLMSMEY
ncbi:zinc metalloprotease HtpX [Candidatus Dojkabacteria bacterium]|nr:zinc metalloprotease HtpX [Candidatus Dojkabacteria bacterium]